MPLEVHAEAFQFVLKLADEQGLLKGTTVGVDSTTLEASAAMNSIVRTAGEDWRRYVVGLMKEQGVVDEDAEPTEVEIRRFDKRRKTKKVINEEWESKSNPGAPDREDEGRPHALGVQGRARDRPSTASGY